MEISEIRVKLVKNSKERLKAVCSVTFENEFVIRDLKVIEGATGLFVAMPSRKLADHCPKCRSKNHLRARFCNECGQKLDDRRAEQDRGKRARLHADIAHPINSQCRNSIQAKVVEAYDSELECSKEPGYEPVDIEDFDSNHKDNSNNRDKEDAGSKEDTGSKEDSGSGYQSLVEELKKDAEERHGRRSYNTAPDEDPEEEFDPEEELDSEETSSESAEAPSDSVSTASPDEDDDGFGAGIL
ncbi:MAG: stage V sporulation protein G [bacterium]|nr:stage V sporulation protein G [bacterium]